MGTRRHVQLHQHTVAGADHPAEPAGRMRYHRSYSRLTNGLPDPGGRKRVPVHPRRSGCGWRAPLRPGLRCLCVSPDHAYDQRADRDDLHRRHLVDGHGVPMMMRLRRRSRGQVLVVFAVSAVALFAVAALAIDGGRILIDQRALQNAIDGAALNGAIDIGPGASATQSATAQDDAINTIEQARGISFSSTYSTYGPHHLAGGCGGAACQPPYAAGTINWTDNSGMYKVTVTTPFTFGSSGDREAFIRIHITHTFTLMIGATIAPPLPINADVVARNYALPYSLYMLKWYDPNDYQQNGSTILQANKNMGTNGSLSRGGGATMTYYCSKLPSNLYGYGGDLHEYDVQTLASSGITPNSIKSSCFSDTPFPGAGLTGSTTTSIALQAPPPVRLPPDPYGSAAAPAPINVTVSGTQMLQPTIPGTVGAAHRPRYVTVSVPNMATLILQPAVYFFEGTAAGSGPQIQY